LRTAIHILTYFVRARVKIVMVRVGVRVSYG